MVPRCRFRLIERGSSKFVLWSLFGFVQLVFTITDWMDEICIEHRDLGGLKHKEIGYEEAGRLFLNHPILKE